MMYTCNSSIQVGGEILSLQAKTQTDPVIKQTKKPSVCRVVNKESSRHLPIGTKEIAYSS